MNRREALHLGIRVGAGVGVIASIMAYEAFSTSREMEENEDKPIEYTSVGLTELISNPAKFKDQYVSTWGYYERGYPVDVKPLEGIGNNNIQQLIFSNKLYLNEEKTGIVLEVRETIIMDVNQPPTLNFNTVSQEIRGKILERKERGKSSYILHSVVTAPGVNLTPTP